MDYKSVLESQIKRLERKSEDLEKKIPTSIEEMCLIAKTIIDLVAAHNKYEGHPDR